MQNASNDDDFAIRFYRFAKADFDREVTNDFPKLRSIKGTEASLTVDLLKCFSPAERLLLMQACLKRAHPRAAELLQEQITAVEHETLTRFDLQRVEQRSQWRYLPLQSKREYKRMFVAQNRPLPLDANEADLLNGIPAKLDSKQFLANLRKRLIDHFAKEPARCGSREWEFATLINSWRLTFNVELGGQFSQLRYWHNLEREGQYLVRFQSVGTWLGLGELNWNLCTIDDTESTATSAASLCRDFVVQATHFVN